MFYPPSLSPSLSFSLCHSRLHGQEEAQKGDVLLSPHSTEFECYDLVVYVPVAMVEDFKYKTLILIGQFAIKNSYFSRETLVT